MLFPSVPTNRIDGAELLAADQRTRTIGVTQRPLGPARFGLVTGEDLFTAAVEGTRTVRADW